MSLLIIACWIATLVSLVGRARWVVSLLIIACWIATRVSWWVVFWLTLIAEGEPG